MALTIDEYGPFGEAIRSTGPMAKANPFRFSTKYQDDETDLLYYGYRFYNASTGRWINRDSAEEFGFMVMLVDSKDFQKIRRILSSSRESRQVLLQNQYYRGFLSRLKVRIPRLGMDDSAVLLYGFVGNDTVMSYDPDGTVAQWVAECGVGCVFGGIGGAIGGIGGGWRGVACGAVGGAITGCCSSLICANAPEFCTSGSCLCGVIGSLAEQICKGGLNYKDPCAWVGLIGSGIAGCVGGNAEQTEQATAKVVAFVLGIDVSALSNLCGH